jgi:hypothetical protein
MRLPYLNHILAAALVATTGMYSMHAQAAGKTDCELRFSLTGWSAIVKHAEGKGVITCTNGSSVHVNIVATGGGLTVGKYQVENGKGKFSDITHMSELLGSYVQGEANAGLVKSGTAQVLTKGNVSLALVAAGEGVNIGISFGKFTITRAR